MYVYMYMHNICRVHLGTCTHLCYVRVHVHVCTCISVCLQMKCVCLSVCGGVYTCTYTHVCLDIVLFFPSSGNPYTTPDLKMETHHYPYLLPPLSLSLTCTHKRSMQSTSAIGLLLCPWCGGSGGTGGR